MVRPPSSLPPTRPRWPALVLCLALAACAGRAPAPASPQPAPAAPGPPVTPPPVTDTGPAAGYDPSNPRAGHREVRRSIFAGAWTLVRDKHYDKTLGGLDWTGLRSKYEPLALGAPDEATFYRFLNQMLGELGQSHLQVSGPGAEPDPPHEEAPPSPDGDGDPGLTVRVIDGRPTVTAVREGSSAARAGLRPGYLITHIGGWAVKPGPSPRALRPVEERFQVRLAAARRLAGAPGSRVTVRALDASDRPIEVVLERDPPRGTPVRLGLLPPLYPDVRVSQVGDVGVLAFNLFLSEGVLPRVQSAIDGFRTRGTKSLV